MAKNSPERRKGLIIGGLSGIAASLLVGSLLMPRADSASPGRGRAIAACPGDYEGVVRVTDLAALDELGKLAALHEVRDSEAYGLGSERDIANLPGELACQSVVSYGHPDKTQVVLLPAGIDVLDRSTFGLISQRPLPAGLELIG